MDRIDKVDRDDKDETTQGDVNERTRERHDGNVGRRWEPAFVSHWHGTEDLARLLAPHSCARDVAPRCDAEWNRMAAMAMDAGLSGLLLERAEQLGLSIPEACFAGLTAGARCVAAKNASLERELENVLSVLNEADVPVMLLKGAALTRSVYDRPELRPMSDVDLLVSAADADRALFALLAGACRRGAELVRDDFFPRFHYEAELWTRSAQHARVDLHVRPFRPLRYARVIADDAMWHDARLVKVGGATAFVPSDERMFVHLAAHAAFHGCSRLIWLYDLVRWCDRCGDGIDWARMIECCRTWKLSAAVHRAMRRAAELYGPAWPDEVGCELARTPTGWRDRMALRQAPNDAASPLRHVICNLITTPGPRFTLGYLRAVLFPDGAHLRASYAGRHAGWRMIAIARRIFRAVVRAIGFPSFATRVGA